MRLSKRLPSRLTLTLRSSTLAPFQPSWLAWVVCPNLMTFWTRNLTSWSMGTFLAQHGNFLCQFGNRAFCGLMENSFLEPSLLAASCNQMPFSWSKFQDLHSIHRRRWSWDAWGGLVTALSGKRSSTWLIEHQCRDHVGLLLPFVYIARPEVSLFRFGRRFYLKTRFMTMFWVGLMRNVWLCNWLRKSAELPVIQRCPSTKPTHLRIVFSSRGFSD